MRAPLRKILLLLGAAVLFFAAFFLAPMLVVAIASVTDADGNVSFASYARILLDRYHWDVLWTTFRIGALTTAATMLIGYPLAWYLVRIVRFAHWRRACIIMLVVPLFTSNIVRSFGWMVLLGRNGLVNDALVGAGLIERPLRFLGTELGIEIGLVYILLPFMVLSIGNALAKVDPLLEQASADLGASPSATFRTITFPLSLPGLMAGTVMVFMLAVSAYVTPALLSGGRITVFSMLIFQQYGSLFDFHYGGALSITMLVLTLALIALAARIGEARGI
ncbi:MAG TPA: ABC transporter permease [Xanthobacteraceae bacterium]|nr:ABC transporter permease [Xanthobacteraceae bacterium]